MCINFNGYHSGGSIFVNVNDCWLLQKLFVYHRYKFSLKKKKIIIRSPSIWFHTPKTVRIRQSGRTGIGGVTVMANFSSGMSIFRDSALNLCTYDFRLSCEPFLTVNRF